MASDTFNILMYSHDTYGLGHIRRTMAIASSLVQEGVNILILTGSPIVGRFDFPKGIDFVRVPGMIKHTNSVYMPHSIRVDPQHAMNIRQNIITETAKAFEPKLFIVDKVPTGLKGECMPTLWWFKQNKPDAKIVLGLRDILDDPQSTREDWSRKNYPQVLEDLYSEIWVYGEQDFYDPIEEYAVPESIARKTIFTGYIPRSIPPMLDAPPDCPTIPPTREPGADVKRVVVTTGGGGDGYPILDTYLTMLETYGSEGLDTLMVAGPFVPRKNLESLLSRAEKLGVEFHTFLNNIEQKIDEADLVVSMGGYNTVCEILSLKQLALIIPRETPRLEQLIRAQVLKERGLADYLPWDRLDPGHLHDKIQSLLAAPDCFRKAVNAFSMTGLEVMRDRLSIFRSQA